MSRKLELAAVFLSPAVLCAALLIAGQTTLLAAAVATGIIWLLAANSGKSSYISACFAVILLLAFLADNSGVSPSLLLLSVSLALAAWDLSRFAARLSRLTPPEYAARLERLHLQRLGQTLAAGLAAGLAAIMIRVEVGFIPEMILAVLAFITLSYLVRGLSAIPLETDN